MAFLVAFCCVFFENSTAETRGFIGSLSFAVAALILWCVATYWQKYEEVPDRRNLAYEDRSSIENEDSAFTSNLQNNDFWILS